MKNIYIKKATDMFWGWNPSVKAEYGLQSH